MIFFGIIGVVVGVVGIWRTEAIVVLRTDRPTVNNEKVMEDIFVKNENEESAKVTDNYVVCDACHLSFSLIWLYTLV